MLTLPQRVQYEVPEAASLSKAASWAHAMQNGMVTSGYPAMMSRDVAAARMADGGLAAQL
jgi:hypothetical protein